jgi:hypothetical protein
MKVYGEGEGVGAGEVYGFVSEPQMELKWSASLPDTLNFPGNVVYDTN